MSSKYRIIINPNSEDVEFEVGDLVVSEVTNYLDSIYGWYSPEQLGIVKKITYMEITDYFCSAETKHKICELQVYWPKTGNTTYTTSSMVTKLTKITQGESDVDL